MANITSKFVSSFSELYFRTTPLTTAEIADPSSWFDDAAIVEIKGLAEIGTLANESTVIEAPEFGEKYKGKLRGQLDAGTLDASVYWSPRSAAHLAMREAASNGTRLSFGIKLKNDAAGTDLEMVTFDGFISSFGIDLTFDDVVKASTTIVIDGEPYFDSPA